MSCSSSTHPVNVLKSLKRVESLAKTAQELHEGYLAARAKADASQTFIDERRAGECYLDWRDQKRLHDTADKEHEDLVKRC
jgi:hypothetical protein